ncbi:AraC family transcriptional regulator [Clostridium sediminicola]|uniref:AraC family transcriptional regulator n=1 Tax=Clostridium sediminicola TaxID=3114879 RepID=UPI0031F2752D
MNLNYKISNNKDKEWYMCKHHFHEYHEILLSLSDAGSLFAENNLYPLKRGTLMLFKSSCLHKTIANECNLYERYVVHFAKDTLCKISTPQTDFLYLLNHSNHCIQLEDDEIKGLINLLEKCNLPESEAFGDDIKRKIAFIEFLLRVCTLLESKKWIDASNSPDFSKMAPIIEYIRANLDKTLNLDSISKHFFISKYHLSRTFKAATGFNVVDYIINCRILKAKELLRQGYSVQSAGEHSGFNNNAHFIRTFGKLTGISPGRYMKKYREGNKQ